uniref:Uncharacterized protein n=1 Tax=Esox lucius TaxID=8010 RepID=A0AAY5LDS6_ESOLU
ACVYVYTHTTIECLAPIYVFLCGCSYIGARHLYIHIYTHTYIYLCIHTYIYLYIHLYIPIYTPIYTYLNALRTPIHLLINKAVK